MTKEQMIERMAAEAGITKAQATRAMKSMITNITKSLKKGGKVTFVGFGTFGITKRKARTGRNPQTGAEIRIPAAKVPKFKAGKALKDAVK
jgi:DNA-binding protein HU-beta